MQITRELVDRYSGGVGATHPWHDTGSPYDRPVAPAAILYWAPARLRNWVVDGAQGIRNTSLTLEFIRPIYVGDTINVNGRIKDRWVTKNRDYVEIEMIATNEAGEEVCRGWQVNSWRAAPGVTPSNLPRRE